MTAPRTAIVLQARLASTRLPAKALARIGHATLLERCLRRLTLAAVGDVVLATTRAPEDDALAAIAAGLGVRVHRGSTHDVLGRCLDAARMAGADIMIRATGDNPLVDIDAAQRVRAALLATAADYACEEGLPLGAGVEAVTVAALARAAAAPTSADDREHVTLYVKRRPDAFRVTQQPAPPSLARPELRFTVDTRADLDHVRRLLATVTLPEPPLAALIAAAAACPRSDAA
jgi:spore coat polysaccharide biosynthesis protein SpsF